MNTSAGQRVLMLLQNSTYPTDMRVRHEARTLVSAGYQVSVISPSYPGQAWSETLDGVHVYRFPALHRAISTLGYLREYGYSLAAIFVISLCLLIYKGFDIVHAHQPPDAFVFIAAFYKLLGKRYIMDHHDLSPELYYARFRGNGKRILFCVLVWLEDLSCRLSDHVIATNQSYRQIEMRRGHVPERRITIVRNGPDQNGLYNVDPYPNLRDKKKVVIGYVEAFGTQDGVDYLLRVLQYLANELCQKGFACVVVGGGDALSRVKSLSQRLNISDYIIWFSSIYYGLRLFICNIKA